MKKRAKYFNRTKGILGRGNDNGLDMLVRLMSLLPSTKTINKPGRLKKVLSKK